MLKEITVHEVADLLKSKEHSFSFIDVREDEEFASGSIPGAIHIPLGELPERLAELDRDKEYIMVCRSGARSGRATEFLEQEGFDARNMVGGMLAWEELG